MKTTGFIGILLVVALAGHTAQAQVQNLNEVSITPPSFQPTNCWDFQDFVLSNINYPHSSINEGLQGTTVVRFNITQGGNVEAIDLINSLSNEIDQEVVRVLQQSDGQWVAGSVDGEAQEMSREVSLTFALHSYDQMVKTARRHMQKAAHYLYVENKPEKALKYINRAYTLLPHDTNVLLNKKVCLEKLGRTSEAEAAHELLAHESSEK